MSSCVTRSKGLLLVGASREPSFPHHHVLLDVLRGFAGDELKEVCRAACVSRDWRRASAERKRRDCYVARPFAVSSPSLTQRGSAQRDHVPLCVC